MCADPTGESTEIRLYEDVGNFDDIKNKWNYILEEYNERNKTMNLVLFNDAMSHMVNLHRIIRFPRGNALLVGVGGSGKQSSTKLGAFAAG